MSQEKHPSISQFREFLGKNPQLVQRVRKGEKTWQQCYEDWYLFGEEDEMWNEYREKRVEENSTTDFLTNAFTYLKKMNPNDLQKHIASIQEGITVVQSLLSQFKPEQKTHPFAFRKD